MAFEPICTSTSIGSGGTCPEFEFPQNLPLAKRKKKKSDLWLSRIFKTFAILCKNLHMLKYLLLDVEFM